MVPLVARSTPTVTLPELPPPSPEPPSASCAVEPRLKLPATLNPPDPPPPPRLCANRPCESTPRVVILLELSTVTSRAIRRCRRRHRPRALRRAHLDTVTDTAKPPLPPPPPTLWASTPYERSPYVLRFTPDVLHVDGVCSPPPAPPAAHCSGERNWSHCHSPQSRSRRCHRRHRCSLAKMACASLPWSGDAARVVDRDGLTVAAFIRFAAHWQSPPTHRHRSRPRTRSRHCRRRRRCFARRCRVGVVPCHLARRGVDRSCGDRARVRYGR